MTISGFLIRFIFLIIPGVLCSVFYRGFRGKRTRKDWEDYLEILVFSLLNYLLFEIVFWFLGSIVGKIFNIDGGRLPTLGFEALSSFLDEKSIITRDVVADIVGASATGFFLAIILSYIDEFKLLNRFGIWIRATKRFGDESVWYFVHRTSEHWKFVRDHKRNLIYFGWIERYSDWWGNDREILMKDVCVYNNETGQKLYHVDNLYVLRKSEDLTIEYPNSSKPELEKDVTNIKEDGKEQENGK